MVGPENGSYTAKKAKSDRFLLDPVQRREREKGVGGRAIDVYKLGKRRRSRQATDVYEGGVNAMGECDTLKDRNCTKVKRFGCVPLFGLFLNANFRIVLK